MKGKHSSSIQWYHTFFPSLWAGRQDPHRIQEKVWNPKTEWCKADTGNNGTRTMRRKRFLSVQENERFPWYLSYNLTFFSQFKMRWSYKCLTTYIMMLNCRSTSFDNWICTYTSDASGLVKRRRLRGRFRCHERALCCVLLDGKWGRLLALWCLRHGDALQLCRSQLHSCWRLVVSLVCEEDISYN